MLRARMLVTIGGIIAILAVFSPGMARADVPPGQIPLSLHTAIQQYIEGKGHDYAGLCVDVNQNPPPYGDYCAFVLSIEHDIAEVSYGPVASGDITRVDFKNTGGNWAPMLSGNPTPSPTQAPVGLPAGLNNAIKAFIESKGHDYAGLCIDVNANPPLPFGEYCAFLLSIEHDIAEISYGPVASGDISLASFRLEGGQWKVIGQAPAPTSTPVVPTPTSPAQPTATPTTPAQPTATPTTPAQPTTTPSVPPALEAAIKARIESIGKEYAGLCVDVNANPPVPFGKYCAFVNSITNGVADVSYGPVATNDITRVSFRLEGSTWKLVTPVTPTKTAVVPLPPSTGSGSDDDGMSTLALAAIISAVVAVSGAGAFAIRRR